MEAGFIVALCVRYVAFPLSFFYCGGDLEDHVVAAVATPA